MSPTIVPDRNHGYRIARRCFAFAIAAVVVALSALLSPASLLTPVMADQGSLDLSFGNGEVVVSPQQSRARMAIQPDGKIVVVWEFTFYHTQYFGVDRYLQSGSLEWRRLVPDSGHSPTSNDFAEVRIRPDGKILVAHTVNGVSKLALFLSHGLLDTSFGSNGEVEVFSFSDVAVLPDNRVVTLTLTYFQVNDANGAFVQTVGLGGDAPFGRLAVGPDGRLVVATTTSLKRYNADLTLDNTFCAGGTCLSPLSLIVHLRVANDGKIVTVNHGSFGLKISRHLQNGDLDLAFGTQGVSDVTELGGVFHFNDLEVDATGRILVALGQLLPGIFIRIIDTDGSTTAPSIGAGIDGNSDIALQEDGKLLVSGTVLHGAILRRFHYADERKSANLRFARTKIIAPTGIRRDDEIEYVIRVVNDGPDKAGHVTFENPLPSGTSFVSFEAPEGWVTYQRPHNLFPLGGKISCSGYSLESGHIAEFRLTVRVKRNVAHGTHITNTSTVESLVPDLTPSNNTTNATVTVQ